MKLSKEFTFEASHRLPNHPGKCQYLHGHSWKLTITIDGYINPTTGFVLDYNLLGNLIKPLVDFLDHKHLNWFIAVPSSEVLCALVAHNLQPLLKYFLVWISISETAKTEAVIRADDKNNISQVLDAGWADVPRYDLHEMEWTRDGLEYEAMLKEWHAIQQSIQQNAADLVADMEKQIDRWNKPPERTKRMDTGITRDVIAATLRNAGYKQGPGEKHLADTLVTEMRTRGIIIP